MFSNASEVLNYMKLSSIKETDEVEPPKVDRLPERVASTKGQLLLQISITMSQVTR
jgi:hypothetical protein